MRFHSMPEIAGDRSLIMLGQLFDRHAEEADDYYANGCADPEEENSVEVRLADTQRALLQAAAQIRHRTAAGRAAKERMLAHLERWAGSDSLPYSEDSESLGGRLARSLA